MNATLHGGDVVSCGYLAGVEPIVGRVIELHRQSDGRPYLKVRIESGPRKGELTWPDAWVLGIGDQEGSCERCGRRFRFRGGDVNHTCARCWGGVAPAVPATDGPHGRYMLNHCRDCGKYKWVYHDDPQDGKGARYICVRCFRTAKERISA